MPELLIAEVIHYYSNLKVAGLRLHAPLRRGDRVHILGHTTDLEELVESMEVNHQKIDRAQPGDDVAIKVPGKVRHGDKVYLETNGKKGFAVHDM